MKVPTGRQWWSVLGWAAFLVGLAIECIALIQKAPREKATEWIPPALYLFWVVSFFLSGEARRLRERIEDDPEPRPPWARGLFFLVMVAALLLVVEGMPYLTDQVGVPFGAVLLGVGVLSWLLRPWTLRLLGKRLRG